MEGSFPRGSEWRRWDLHFHTSASFDYKNKDTDSDKDIIKTLRKENIKAVAITDHFVIDAKKIMQLRKMAPEITFFPGVELRTDKGSKQGNLHIILIFSENYNVEELQDDFEAIMIRDKAKDGMSNEKIHWSYSDIIEFAERRDAIITIHAGGKTNGVDDQISNALPVNRAIKSDMSKGVHFFELGNKKDISPYKNEVFKHIDPKPLIICSDNHNAREYSVSEKLWIKANTTFEGLKQCIYQPEERVFIGDMPPLVDRKDSNKQLIIDELSIQPNEFANTSSNNWFNTHIKFNPGLVSIIGNKGSGKSAFSDILAHMCEAQTMDYASFLSEKRFKKEPQNYAKDYQATIKWLDRKINKKKLSEDMDTSLSEYAQYLPQQYIEDVCNDLGDSFQKEINKVIFSYVDESERGDAVNLEELVLNRSKSIRLNIDNLKMELSNVNNKIIKLEFKKTESYRNELEKGLKFVKESIERHCENKPIELKKPENELNEKYQSKLETLNREIEETEKAIVNVREKQALLNKKLDDLKALQTKINILIEETAKVNKDIDEVKNTYDIGKLQDMIISTPIEYIKSLISMLKGEREEIRDVVLNEDSTSDKSLLSKLTQLKEEKENLIASADNEERAYQKNISDIKKWQQKLDELIGDSTTDKTQKYYENELKYLDERIEREYQDLIHKRIEISRQIFRQKIELSKIHTEIYKPIEQQISKLVNKMDEVISFEVELVLKNYNLAEELLDYVNQRFAGIFKGKTESIKKMNRYITETDFSSMESLEQFIDKIMNVVYEDLENSSKKVTDKNKFYMQLFELDYIGVNFQLKMGKRSLSELSPGERGLVLLTFFLALSKDNKPIIIDQPEDNLDNQSVFRRLVPCINEAKERRQVFIVTHNPNIAIACDSDQIIYAEMNKETYEITYNSGAIEAKETNDYIINVLEGTMPAFDLRRRKYTVK